MKKLNFNLGGEQSGHIILGKFATTGDGLLVALEVLFALRKGKKASSFFNNFKKLYKKLCPGPITFILKKKRKLAIGNK
mgnify:CR=1 FL=1